MQVYAYVYMHINILSCDIALGTVVPSFIGIRVTTVTMAFEFIAIAAILHVSDCTSNYALLSLNSGIICVWNLRTCRADHIRLHTFFL